MPQRPPDQLDLSSTPPDQRRDHPAASFADALAAKGHVPDAPTPGPRRWLGIYFSCCNVYARVYRSPTRPRYEGHCPRCNAILTVPIGDNGTNQRFFEAS